jgi:UV DNA damage repair endonuclease
MSRHETVVEITKAQVEEMLRAYVMAKFGFPATQFHEIRLTVHPEKFVVRVIDPPSRPTSSLPQ